MSDEKVAVPKRQGLPRLLWGMIVRPRRALASIDEFRKRSWWLSALLAVLFAILPVIVAAPITAQRSREAVAATQEQFGEDASDEERAQMEQAMSVVASPLITVVFPAVGSALGLAVGWLIWAGALYLAGLALGGRSTFGQMLPMVIWTWFPYALRGLLQTVYILASGQIIANPGLSGFVLDNRSVGEMIAAPPSMGETLLASFLSRVDIFLIWHMILLVIGVRVTTKLPRRKSALVTLGVWLLLTALGLIPALVGGFFTRQAGIS